MGVDEKHFKGAWCGLVICTNCPISLMTNGDRHPWSFVLDNSNWMIPNHHWERRCAYGYGWLCQTSYWHQFFPNREHLYGPSTLAPINQWLMPDRDTCEPSSTPLWIMRITPHHVWTVFDAGCVLVSVLVGDIVTRTMGRGIWDAHILILETGLSLGPLCSPMVSPMVLIH